LSANAIYRQLGLESPEKQLFSANLIEFTQNGVVFIPAESTMECAIEEQVKGTVLK